MAADNPDASRPRRAPVRPSFDPMTQPWVPSELPFGPVPERFLTPAWIKQVLTGSIQRPLNIPDESLRRAPGREGTPVEAARCELGSVSEYADEEGKTWKLSGLRGKVVVVNFWATWCPPCVEELPMIEAFSREHAAKGLQVLALAIDQPSAVRRFLERQALSFPVGLAGLGGTELARSLGNAQGGLPFSVFFAADGSIYRKKLGQLTPQDLKDWAQSQA